MSKQNKPKKEHKQKWGKKEIAKYFKESNQLSDYSCKRQGIIESRYKKKR